MEIQFGWPGLGEYRVPEFLPAGKKNGRYQGIDSELQTMTM